MIQITVVFYKMVKNNLHQAKSLFILKTYELIYKSRQFLTFRVFGTPKILPPPKRFLTFKKQNISS